MSVTAAAGVVAHQPTAFRGKKLGLIVKPIQSSTFFFHNLVTADSEYFDHFTWDDCEASIPAASTNWSARSVVSVRGLMLIAPWSQVTLTHT